MKQDVKPGKPRRSLGRRLLSALLWLIVALVVAVALFAAFLFWRMERSAPRASGEVAVAGLSAPVTIARDAAGNATVTGSTRRDVAFALGWLHAQDRLFQMDTLRRAPAGELSVLSGALTADIDRAIRPHRFRARARAIVAAMPPAERALLEAYTAGVNRGAANLSAAPFEYGLLFADPEPWRLEDTVLAVYAMYLNLQSPRPERELDRARAARLLGAEMAAFLYPSSTELDAPLDGSLLPEPAMPRALAPLPGPPSPAPALAGLKPDEEVGSNNWAVGGRLTASGAALVANDMHLGIGVPSTWYRARMIVRPAAGSAERAMDVAGVTLPGTPFLVAGSNGRVAWGFTNSNVDSADAVIVEWVDEAAGTYRVPGGTARVRDVAERICLRGDCEAFPVRETIWGPIVGKDAFGRTLAMRWTAHLPDAVRLGPALALEQAGSVADALDLARRSAIPQQNFTVGDRDGNIGWTIIGQVPARFGFSGQEAVSFADGSRGWAGTVAPDAVPAILNPAGDRIWTANGRVVGGAALAVLGDGGYAPGTRAGRIRDLLRAKDRFGPADFLAIQLDTRSPSYRFWQALLLKEIAARRGDARLEAMRPYVERWGERAVPESVGYRLVATFRNKTVDAIYEAYLGKPPEGGFRRSYAPYQAEGPARRLLRERPPGLVPPGFPDWNAFMSARLATLADDVDEAAGGRLERYRWGEVATARVSHPLARAIAPLGWAINPPDEAVPGDRPVVRAQAPGFGASQRFAVSPGREAEGLFHMPGGQSGNPRAPWYLGGHRDWVEGRPTPFLPGPTRWTLVLRPAA